MYECCFCDFKHPSFEVVADHQASHHRKDCEVNNMFYPLLRRQEDKMTACFCGEVM